MLNIQKHQNNFNVFGILVVLKYFSIRHNDVGSSGSRMYIVTAVRIRKNSNFVVLDKTCISDNKLSLQAKGLHTLLMGFPDDWKIHLNDLVNRSSNGRDATRKAFNELIASGYIVKEQVRDSGKFGGFEYIVMEEPNKSQCVKIDRNTPRPENPSAVKSPPRPEKPAPVNPTLLNNNNTKNNNSTVNSTVMLPKAKKGQGIVSDVISGKLDTRQRRYLKAMFTRLKEQGVSISHPGRVFDECIFAIENSEQMVGVKSFKHQVNIISKLIRRGRWLTPKGFHNHSQRGSELKMADENKEKERAVAKIKEVHSACGKEFIPLEGGDNSYESQYREICGKKVTQEKYLADLFMLKKRDASLVNETHIHAVESEISMLTTKLSNLKIKKETINAAVE